MKNLRRKIRDLIWFVISKFHKNVMVCYGTSLTEGSGWVKILAKKLPDWHIVNLAKGGMNSNWGMDNLKTVLLFKPKIVLMEWAINDSYVKCPYYRETRIGESYLNVVKMINKFETKKIRVIMLGMNPPFDMYLSGRNPTTVRPLYRDYAKLHEMVAYSKVLQYINITEDWDRLTKDEFLHYCPDGLHPNILASRDIIVPKIIKEIIL